MAPNGTAVLKAGHRGVAAKADGVPADLQEAALDAAARPAPQAAPDAPQPGNPNDVDTVTVFTNSEQVNY